MKLLWYYLMAIGMTYLGIPILGIESGFRSLCQHEAYKEKETEYGERLIDFHSTTFAAWKIFEQFGEAIPQVSDGKIENKHPVAHNRTIVVHHSCHLLHQ